MNMKHTNWVRFFLIAGFALITGCASSELKPVDIYPEDSCAQCRMAVSDRSFASEIITLDDEVFKFDDLGCLESYRKKNPQTVIRAIFVSDYEKKTWLPFEKSIIVKTGLTTPMASGKVAFADSKRALAFVKANPPDDLSEGGCGSGCCSGTMDAD